MIFYKTSSFGNDFIEIDCRDLPTAAVDKSALAREICDRQRGVGADGVVFYSIEKIQVHFQIYNRDGGEAELSGNGMAGLAAVLLQRRLVRSPLTLHAAIGARRIEQLGREGACFRLHVEIGTPDFANHAFFPFLRANPGRSQGCRPLGETGPYHLDGLDFHPVAVGNPHAVVIDRDKSAPGQLAALGEKVEGHAMFPKRVNVEFVDFTDPENCRVFFYERGVGPTQASLTGSAAVFAVLRKLGLVQDRLAIACGAETIRVSWDNGIFVDNITCLICRGKYFI
jgi:diaminopimelate epimerase